MAYVKSRRKHRRVKGVPPGWRGCKCPEGTRKVSTCTSSKRAKKKGCKGRGWGCLGIGPSQTGKPSPRFVAAICPVPPKALPKPSPAPPRLPPAKPPIRVEVKVSPSRRAAATKVISAGASVPQQRIAKRVSARRKKKS